MKKTLLAAVFALLSTTAMNAQISKGTWMLSGSTGLSFNSTTTKVELNDNQVGEDMKTNSFSFNPAASYFVIDNLAVGLGLGFNSSKVEDNTSSTFTVMPQATYFFPNASNVKPYLGAGVGYASNKTETSVGDITTDGLSWKASGGIAYLFNPSVALTLGVDYLGTSLSPESNKDTKVKTGTIAVGAGIAVFLK